MRITLGWDIVLKLGAFGLCLMVAMQVLFYFVFQLVGYDAFWLSTTLIMSVVAFILLLVLWRVLRKTVGDTGL